MYSNAMRQYTVAEARAAIAEVIDRASSEPVSITRHGEPVAVVVEPCVFAELLNAFEELSDQRDFDEAMSSGVRGIPWSQVKRDLGLG